MAASAGGRGDAIAERVFDKNGGRRQERTASWQLLLGGAAGEFGAGGFQLDLDLAALTGINGVPQLRAQFLDVLFQDHRHLLDVL
jgi:hypothetical protein